MDSPSLWTAPPSHGPRLLRVPVTLLRLSGPDSLRFLHGQSSQDLALAKPGDWRSTCCITPTARLRALAEVLVEDGGALLVITAGDGAAVRQAFDRVLFPADAVSLGPVEPGVWLESLADLAAAPAAGEGRWSAEPGGGWRLGRALVLSAQTPLPPELALLSPLEPWEQEWRRLRLGLPASPGEINDGVNPFELGLAPRVSLSKGCYVGQETLARLATYDGVKQQLRRWQVAAPGADAAAVPAPQGGCTLRTAVGERAGVISSALALPDGSGWVGLALVRRAALGETSLWCSSAPTAPDAGDAAATADAQQAVAGSTADWCLELSVPELFQPPPLGAGSPSAQAA